MDVSAIIIALHSPHCGVCHQGFIAGQRFLAIGPPYSSLVHESCFGSQLVNRLLLTSNKPE